MTDSISTLDAESSLQGASGEPEDEALALMIAWSATEPHRVGEVALFDIEGAPRILGRGGGTGGERLGFFRQRPGVLEATPPLQSLRISREQLRIAVRGRRLVIERIGRCPMIHAGEPVDRCSLEPGDTLLLKGELLFYCTQRSRKLPPLRNDSRGADFAFGESDTHGIVGESPAAFRLRDQLAWTAKAGAHTLILGESGTGKELAARALHALSARVSKPFVARNTATIPASLIDAELFGNVKGYPNPGMPERPGLIGAAEGGTLFLDEIGELPASLQANLLRVLDADGEYHRLGSSTARRADIRLIGATNRDPAALKHDLAARLVLRIVLPGLTQRREDIPLLVRHLLRRAAAKSPEVVGRFMAPSSDGLGEPRIHPDLVDRLLTWEYTTNVRELEALLWRCMAASSADAVEWADDLAHSAPVSAEGAERPDDAGPVVEPSAEEIRTCLASHHGNVSRAAKALGLSSRYALYRLLKKHGIDAR